MARGLIVVVAFLQASVADASCVDAALAHLGAEVRARETFFLTPGEVRSGAHRFEVAACVTVLAAAENPEASVNGVLRSDSGLDLAVDGPRTPHAALRFCGAAGVTLHWSVRVTAPSEIGLAVVGGGPWPLPDLGRELGGCFAGAPGLRSADPDLGPPPPTPAAAERLRRFIAAERRRGYALDRQDVLRLDRGRARLPLILEGGRCYVLGVFPASGALDVSLLSPDGREIAADRRRSVDGTLADCPEHTSERLLVAHGAGGAERATVAVVSQRARGSQALGTSGRRPWVELEARYGPLSAEGWVHLQSGESLDRELDWRGCGVVAVFAAPEARGALVELQLLDTEERLLASSRGAPPRVRSCARGIHLVRLRMLRGAGRFLLARTTDGAAGGRR